MVGKGDIVSCGGGVTDDAPAISVTGGGPAPKLRPTEASLTRLGSWFNMTPATNDTVHENKVSISLKQIYIQYVGLLTSC